MVTSQLRDRCRRIISESVPVRSERDGNVIGTLREGRIIYIANEGNQGWVPVERPVNGYVKSANMGLCPQAISSETMNDSTMTQRPETPGSEDISTVPNRNCRRVISENIPVRREPNQQPFVTLDKNQIVYIANEGRNGFVPIEQPINGYVKAMNLGYCSR